MDVIKRNMTSRRMSTISRLLAAMTVMVLLPIPVLTSSCSPICNCTKSPWLNDGLHPSALPQYRESLGNCACQGNGLIPSDFLDVIGLTVEYFDHVVIDNGSFTDSSFDGLYRLTLSGVQYIKPGGFRAVADIKKLIFRDTFMNILDKNVFMGLSKLGEISADDNNINALKDGCFEGLGDLRNLSLVNNSIWGVSRNNFLGLVKLQRLDLSMNNLVRLTPQTFALMPELQYLTIQHNAIARIEQGAFLNLTKLITLYLDGNQIQVLTDPLMFRVDQQGVREFTVILHNNPLECDCRLNWIATWLDIEGIQCSGTCQSPDKFKGHTLDSVYKDPLPQCRGNNSVIRVHGGSMAILTCPITYATWVVPGNITLQDYGQSQDDHYYLTNSDSLVVWNTQLQQRGTYQCISVYGDQLMVYRLDVHMSKAHIAIIAVSAAVILVILVIMFCFIRRCCWRRGYQKMKNSNQVQDPLDIGNNSVEDLQVQTYNNVVFHTKPEEKTDKDQIGLFKRIGHENFGESVASKVITK